MDDGNFVGGVVVGSADTVGKALVVGMESSNGSES